MNAGEFRERHESLYQLISYAVLGLAASAAELAAFALCNYLLFGAYKDVGFRWWVLDYNGGNGGLCYFLSLSASYVVGQVVSFFLQRKRTFRADNDPLWSALMFAAMVTGIFFLQLWMPSVLRPYAARLFGANAAELLLKVLGMFVSFAITFPLNKYVVMRRRGRTGKGD